MTDFVHLRLHTEFSIVDGLVRVKPLVERVAALGMPAVAVTDVCNFYGLIKMYKAAFGAGVQPIFGVDLKVLDADDPERAWPLCLLAMNQRVIAISPCLISRAYTEGQYLGVPYVHKSWLEEYAEGVIALSAGAAGELGRPCWGVRPIWLLSVLRYWMDLYPGVSILSCTAPGVRGTRPMCTRRCAGYQMECPVVATNDVRFLDASEFEAHEARVCIGEGRTLDDPRRARQYTDQQYLRSPRRWPSCLQISPRRLPTRWRLPGVAIWCWSWASPTCRTIPCQRV